MGTRLLQIVTFTNVAAAATVVLPHTLNIAGTPVIPDFVVGDVGDFTISANAATVTVTNNGDAPATINVWLERKHTTPRELGGGITNMTPQPFVAASSGGGGGGGADVTTFASNIGTVSIIADITTLSAVAFDGVTAPIIAADQSLLVELKGSFGAVPADGVIDWALDFHIEVGAIPTFPSAADFNFDTFATGVRTTFDNSLYATKIIAGTGAAQTISTFINTTIAFFNTLNIQTATVFYKIIPTANIV